MNNKWFFVFCAGWICFAASNPSDARIAKRNFREVITTYTDELDSDKSFKRLEKYNPKGDLVSSIEWDNQGKLVQRIDYETSPEFEKKVVFSSSDSVIFMEYTKYDKRGRKIHNYVFDKKKNRSEETHIEYNKWGEKSIEKTRKNSRLVQVRLFEYNELGLVVLQKTTDSVGTLLATKTFNYSK